MKGNRNSMAEKDAEWLWKLYGLTKPGDLVLEDIAYAKPLVFKGVQKGLASFKGEHEIDHAGVLDYAIRVFPKNSLLANKQETRLLRYI